MHYEGMIRLGRASEPLSSAGAGVQKGGPRVSAGESLSQPPFVPLLRRSTERSSMPLQDCAGEIVGRRQHNCFNFFQIGRVGLIYDFFNEQLKVLFLF